MLLKQEHKNWMFNFIFKNNCQIISKIPLCLFVGSPSLPCQPLTSVVSGVLPFLNVMCNSLRSLLSLSVFTYQSPFEFHPFCCVCQYFVLLISRHCVEVPQFVCLLTGGRTFKEHVSGLGQL